MDGSAIRAAGASATAAFFVSSDERDLTIALS